MGRLFSLAARWTPVARKLGAPVLASFLCAVLVVVKPIAALSDKYAFLVLTIQVLFFFPGGTVGAQLESTVLGIAGGIVGLAWSCVGVASAAELNRRNGGAEAIGSRILAGFFLAIQSVIGGYIRSSSPRLTSATRIALFHSIWICANDFGHTELTSDIPLILLYPTLFAAGASLFARILFPKTSAGRFINLTQKAFETSETLLLAIVEDFFDKDASDDELEAPRARNVPTLRRQLLAQSTELPKAFAQASYEVSLSRYHPHHLRPFITTIRELGQHLAAGTSYFTGSSPSETTAAGRASFEGRARSRAAFEKPTRRFITSMIAAFSVVHRTLAGEDVGALILDTQARLREQRSVFIHESDRQLDAAIERWEANTQAKSNRSSDNASPQLDKDLLLLSLFNYKCLEVAQTLEDVLDLTFALSSTARASRSIHLPRLSRQWLGSNSVTARWDETARDQSGAEGEGDIFEGMETRAAIANAFLAEPQYKEARFGTVTWMSQKLLPIWDSRTVVAGRMKLVAFLHGLHKRRSHIQHAFKIGLGIVLLTLPAFLPVGSSGREWFKMIRGEWIPISYLFVLETSAGQTWRVGTFRVIGTVIGAILACLITLIAQDNPFALVFLTTLFGTLTAVIMLFSSFPGVGVVGTITLPPIVFLGYLGLPNDGYVNTALKRTATVCIGIVAAVFANEFIFPARSRGLFLDTMAEALDDLTKLYLAMARGNMSGKRYALDRVTASRLQQKIETNLDRSSGHLSTMRLEFSLIHKPLSLYRKVIDAAQNLSDIFIQISVIREQIPRQETVLDVLKERKELVSSVMIHLFACTASFRSRTPMPQFLPSPALAVRNWEISALKGLMSHGGNGLTTTQDGSDDSLGDIALNMGEANTSHAAVLHRDAAFLYTFAEAEALEEAIRTVDDLTTLVRTLFGTSTFFNGSEPLESA